MNLEKIGKETPTFDGKKKSCSLSPMQWIMFCLKRKRKGLII